MKKKKILTGVLCSLLTMNVYSEDETKYMNKYEREEYEKMSTGKKVLYGGGLAGIVIGGIIVADNISSDSSGTDVEIGDPPPEETPTLLSISESRSPNKDLARTVLVARDISRMYQDRGISGIKKDEDTLDIFIEGAEGKGEYTGILGGIYGMKKLWEKGNLNLKGSIAYSHMETSYETSADGRSDTVHLGLHLGYSREKIYNYTWIGNEFSYNRYDDNSSDNYKSNFLRVGNELSYELGNEGLSIRPYLSVEGGYLSMGDIEVDDTRAASETYYSLRWGPGIEMVKELEKIEGILRVGYVREEGNIYDEFSMVENGSSIKIKDLEDKEALEMTVEMNYRVPRGKIYARGKYILRDESNSIIGSLGFRYNI